MSDVSAKVQVDRLTNQVQSCQKKIKDAELEMAQLETKEGMLLTRLHEEFSVNSVGEAKELVQKMNEEVEQSLKTARDIESTLDEVMTSVQE